MIIIGQRRSSTSGALESLPSGKLHENYLTFSILRGIGDATWNTVLSAINTTWFEEDASAAFGNVFSYRY